MFLYFPRLHFLTSFFLLRNSFLFQRYHQLLCRVVSDGRYAGGTVCDDIQRLGRDLRQVSASRRRGEAFIREKLSPAGSGGYAPEKREI